MFFLCVDFCILKVVIAPKLEIESEPVKISLKDCLACRLDLFLASPELV